MKSYGIQRVNEKKNPDMIKSVIDDKIKDVPEKSYTIKKVM